MRFRLRLPVLPVLPVLVAFVIAAANCAPSAGGLSPLPTGPQPPPAGGPLAVRLYDPYRLLSDGVAGWVRDEVARVFAPSGIGVRFVDGGGAGVIPATLYPELPSRWDVVPEAIGVAIGAAGKARSVFLSLGAAERALGVPRDQRTIWAGGPGAKLERRGTERQPKRLGIALGRVLAHELTHIIAPDCPHTTSGLMSARLSRRMLTAPVLRFDALATSHLRRAAATLVDAGAFG